MTVQKLTPDVDTVVGQENNVSVKKCTRVGIISIIGQKDVPILKYECTRVGIYPMIRLNMVQLEGDTRCSQHIYSVSVPGKENSR